MINLVTSTQADSMALKPYLAFPLTGYKPIAVLFARSDSVYKTLFDLDVYDELRDARSFSGSQPVIAHPPCRAWARLRGLAKPQEHEKDLALLAVDLVRKNGGVLEHPESSTLWAEKNLPNPLIDPGTIDEFGGFTLPIQQFSFGHKARKNTWLYICGISPRDLPSMPFRLGEAEYVVTHGKRTKKWKKEITLAEREHTPLLLAEYLVEIARLIQVKKALKQCKSADGFLCNTRTLFPMGPKTLKNGVFA